MVLMSFFSGQLHRKRHGLFGRLFRRKTKLSEKLKEIIKRKEVIEAPPPPKKPPIEVPTEELVDMSGGYIELDVEYSSG